MTGTRARVVVAMSGGVDSSVAAALMVERGHEVVGVTLQLYDHGAAIGRSRACCAGRDVHDARAIADRLGIAHYVLDFEERFRRAVIDDFVDTYAAGRTPVPCIRCNERVKFGDLIGIARELGAEALVTGHYARKVAGPSGPELHRAVDPARDQSYFLFATTADQLDFLELPIGERSKAETRAVARRMGLAVADKPDSQDICFVPDGDYAALVRRLRPEAARPGDIVHADGRTVGHHAGVAGFTVGQRRGLGVALQERSYVIGIDAAAARVTIGPRDAGLVSRARIERAAWHVEPDPADAVQVKHRYNEPAVAARIEVDGDAAWVMFDVPQAGVAPGQACVAYRGERVLGGGWIASTGPGAAP